MKWLVVFGFIWVSSSVNGSSVQSQFGINVNRRTYSENSVPRLTHSLQKLQTSNFKNKNKNFKDSQKLTHRLQTLSIKAQSQFNIVRNQCLVHPVLRLIYWLRILMKERVSTLVQSQLGINVNRRKVWMSYSKYSVPRLTHFPQKIIRNRIQFYKDTNQSNVLFKISWAAAHILPEKPHERMTVNWSVKSIWHKC